MATAGIQVIGDNGNVQIDQTYANLSLVSKGTGTMVDSPDFGRASVYTLSVTGEFPIIAWRSSFPLAILSLTHTGSTWTFTLATNDENVGKTFTYYVFGRPALVGSNFGFQVFDSAGKLNFDSNQRYLKIAGIDSQSIGPSGTVVNRPSSTYAVAISMPAMAVSVAVSGSAPVGVAWTATFMLLAAYPLGQGYAYESTQLATSNGTSAAPPTYPSTLNGKIMLIDVSGL